MNCLTPKKALEGHCGFLAANLYARSTFGACVQPSPPHPNNGSSLPVARF
jgi:hypothetical protein